MERRKYPPELKRAAVDRVVAGEGATAVARELGIRRKFLYQEKPGTGISQPAEAGADSRKRRSGWGGLAAKEEGGGTGKTGRPAIGGTGFFRLSLAQQEGRTPVERRGYREGIYRMIQSRVAQGRSESSESSEY